MKKNLILVFLLFFSLFLAFAQNLSDEENLPPELLEIQNKIESAVLERSFESVSEILKNHKNDKNYPKIESLVLDETRKLVLEEDFYLAKNLAMAVIENNIENFDAIDLYSFIEKTLANERAYQRRAELYRYRAQ